MLIKNKRRNLSVSRGGEAAGCSRRNIRKVSNLSFASAKGSKNGPEAVLGLSLLTEVYSSAVAGSPSSSVDITTAVMSEPARSTVVVTLGNTPPFFSVPQPVRTIVEPAAVAEVRVNFPVSVASTAVAVSPKPIHLAMMAASPEASAPVPAPCPEPPWATGVFHHCMALVA